MAYTKTTWQNNVTDIDANNLNKIEQGIYDNSLVVDAVTNTLNPTDTETYKTAELTEGQITDVIGVSDILIKGQTSQDGEPTPSAPVDVNVVSGSNVVNTSNKNILNLSKYSTQTVNGVKLEFENGAIICNGTATANVIVNLLESNLTLQQGAYALSGCPSGGGVSSNYKLDIFKVSTSAQLAYDIGNGTTFTLSEQTTFDRVRLVIFSGKTVNNLVFKPQLEISSTVTTYEPHQGKELPLDLPVENLFDKDNDTMYLNGITPDNNGLVISVQTSPSSTNFIRTLIVPCQPSTTYTIQKLASKTFFIYDSNIVPVLNTQTTLLLRNDTGNKSTITTSNNAKYLIVKFYNTWTTESVTYENMINSIQIEIGSKANAYTPYGTDPIELCKIGNYQDYFYKSGSKWYLHKEVGKDVVDENTSLSEQSQSGFYRYSYINNKIRNDSSLANSLILFSNYFKAITFTNRSTELDETIFSVCNGISGHNSIQFNTKTFTSLSDFKTWLASNNVILYYLLNEVTNTEITNTTLISQLEAIYNAPLYEETNIAQTNNDLPMVLDITACKDNINGIKAFIRK